jgi:phosphoribosylformylglycinamidine synthase
LRLQTGEDHDVRVKHVITFDSEVSDSDLDRIKSYIINPNEKQESSLEDKKLERAFQDPENHVILDGFTDIADDQSLDDFIKKHSLSLNVDDIRMVHEYFRDEEKRNPTKVEIMLIDTYWSDHCRHTTFFTEITDVNFTG